MKKVLFLSAVLVAAFAFTSCKKNCKCTEATTGLSKEIKTDDTYKTCSDIEDLLKATAAATPGAENQSWSCK